MKRLFEIGFAPVGCWRLRDGQLNLELTDKIDHSNVLYAFISGDEMLYVGKTTKTLRGQLASYLKPTSSQSTNVWNNRAIRGRLVPGNEVDIFALPDIGLHRYGDLKINVAAALEGSSIVRCPRRGPAEASRNRRTGTTTRAPMQKPQSIVWDYQGM
jgi:hypothetical protein